MFCLCFVTILPSWIAVLNTLCSPLLSFSVTQLLFGASNVAAVRQSQFDGLIYTNDIIFTLTLNTASFVADEIANFCICCKYSSLQEIQINFQAKNSRSLLSVDRRRLCSFSMNAEMNEMLQRMLFISFIWNLFSVHILNPISYEYTKYRSV